MERIVCVSHAKVPIVKIWDPELQVACDMNVNNTMALENTRMIRTYVDVDERVRPLAMILKYWTKRRILNDAGTYSGPYVVSRLCSPLTIALGGTLSSYTWICLIINFLQTRSPPVLPSLQQRAIKAQKLRGNEEPSPSFDDDLETLKGFGSANKSTLGELLFQFFRYYGHEVDYEKNVFSVREGTLISKEEKGWHLLQNNRLCVEEPFNTSRNLGNTADDTSFRGLHLELRRAFEVVSKGDLRSCCEQYEYPAEEERTWERPAPQPRAILTPMPAVSSRGGRGGGRGGRNAGHYHRGPSSMGRRASNTGNRSNIRSAANPAFAADIALQAQQAQSILHDQLYQRIQILQAQEHELRMQLQNQALITGRAPPTLIRQPYLQFPLPQHDAMPTEDNSRVRAASVNQPPLTAPLRQNVFFNSSSYVPVTLPAVQGTNTNPPSPSLVSVVPESRRNHRRSSVANGSPRGLRAQSQPARPVQSTSVPTYSLYSPLAQQDANVRRSPEFPQRAPGEGDYYLTNGVPIPKTAFVDESIPAEYIGYYVGDTSQPHGYYRGPLVSSLSGLAVPNCDIPAFLHNSPEYRTYLPTSSEQSNGGSPEHANTSRAGLHTTQRHRSARSQTVSDRGPLIVDGSVPPSDPRHLVHNQSSEQFMTDLSTSSSADRTYDTSRTTPDTLSQGLHEQGSYDDLFGSSYETRHGSQTTGHVNEWEPSLNHDDTTATHMGRAETLSERLQRFQLSDPSFAFDTSGTVNAGRYRGTHLYPTEDDFSRRCGDGSSSDDTPAQVLSPALQSPAKDSRALSTPTKHRFNGVDLEKTNGVLHKSKSKGRNEVWANSSSKDKHSDQGGKPNGLHYSHMGVTNGYSSGPSSWQTPKRKPKKGSKVPAEHTEFAVRAEPLPADESLRKGG